MAKFIQLPNSRPSNPAESLVVQSLVDRLPDTYTIIPNAQIAQRGGPPFEYDGIVIAPHAIYVIEVKRWLGGIKGDDFMWVVGDLHHRPNPLLTANNKARVLKSALAAQMPGLGQFWVEAVVAIVDDAGQINLRGRCRNRVFRHAALAAFLTDREALEGKAGDLRPMRANLEAAVQQASSGRPTGPLQYGSYRVIETLSRGDLVSEFLARNVLLPQSPPVRLRVFSYNPYLPPAQLETHQALLRREAEALQRIGYHPNLIPLRSFEAAPEDPNLFIEVTDWSEAGTLRSLMNAGSLSLERKLELALGMTAGLIAAHAAAVVHRDLRPENLLIGSDGAPRLMNFEHSRLEAPGAATVGYAQPDPSISQAYFAPELLLANAKVTPAADLYSLGMVLFELLTGEVLPAGPQDAQAGPTTPTGSILSISDVPPDLNQLVRDLLQTNPALRPQAAKHVWTRLREIYEKPSGTAAPPPLPLPATGPPEQPTEPAIFRVDDVIDGKYQVQKVLDPGGFGQVYKVYDGILDEVYALKVFSNPSLSLNALQREAGALAKMDHPNIVKVRSWGHLTQSDRFYLLSEFIEGEELSRFTSPDQRLSVSQAVGVVLDLLNALEYLHPNVDRIAELRKKMAQGEISGEDYEEFTKLQEEGWLHRDIKPGNLILSPTGVKLIDFNIAARASQAGNTLTGTPGYMLPSVGVMRWNTESDLFATAVVLYELVTGRHPYPDREPGAAPPTNPRDYVPELSPAFAELLLKGVSCTDTEHYHSSRRFRKDLLDLEDNLLRALPMPSLHPSLQLDPQEIGRSNYNPYVSRLLKLYSQARRDNSGTRGLDEIGRLTYVDTRLDRELQPAILGGEYRLVIITGNAGDGKTAFIQNLEQRIELSGGTVEHPTENSSRFQYRGLQFITNYDGSQDEGAERANDQVLSEFFLPFDDAQIHEAAKSAPVHLIAINEGRLVDFFSDLWSATADKPKPVQRYRQLGAYVQSFFERNHENLTLPDWLLIVDLNQRSIVAPDSDLSNTSIFDRQLLSFLKPEIWQPCETCALKGHCFIKYNVDSFRDAVSGPVLRARVRALFEIVHLRLQLHITMRDLRSALSWMLFRDHDCQEVAEWNARVQRPADLLGLLYYNAFRADDTQELRDRTQDRLVLLLRQIDPAMTANPATDRVLHFRGIKGLPMLAFDSRVETIEPALAAWSVGPTWQAAHQTGGATEYRHRHAFLRRAAFFERRDSNWEEMLPYRHLDDFKAATNEQIGETSELMQKVARGFSFVEGARLPDLASEYICIRAGQIAKARVRAFRLFPLTEFKIRIPRFTARRFIEYTNYRFALVHDPSDSGQVVSSSQRATLTVSLDILELLEEINAGYVPSADDVGGIFVNLLTFKNALGHLPYTRALLTRDNKNYFELTRLDPVRLRVQRWHPVRDASNEN